MKRGSFEFEANDQSGLVNSTQNVEALRRLWLDRLLINGNDLGPGDPGDFDNGAWHMGCHVVAASGVRRVADGRLLLLEISHGPTRDSYFASLTVRANGGIKSFPLESQQARSLLERSSLLGFIEGNSVGHISARGANDPPDRFNRWQRQAFDQPADSPEDGGKVWEHWCTLRDIRPSQMIASSTLGAYVAVVAALGDLFVATVARGRRSYGHPQQLCALVKAGFTSEQAATWDTKPLQIPAQVERLFLEARPADTLAGAEQLSWEGAPRYFMFARRISEWSPASAVRSDLQAFGR